MTSSAELVTVNNLDTVARALRELGDKELSRELFRGLNRVTTELKKDAKEEAVRRLPRRGGLGAKVGKSRLSTGRRGGRNPGLVIRAKGISQLPKIEAGEVRHPTYGHKPFVTQQITGGWFTDPMYAGRDEIIHALDVLLEDLATKAAHKIRVS